MCCIKSEFSVSPGFSLSRFTWPLTAPSCQTRCCFMPCLHQIQCSCQAPYLCIWLNCSPLRVPLRAHLLSHEQIKLPVTMFKELLNSPPTTHHLGLSSLLPHPPSPAAPLLSEASVLASQPSTVLHSFCRAAMSHPFISIYIPFSDKAAYTSLPADCKLLWPKLQRFFTKSLTHYS